MATSLADSDPIKLDEASNLLGERIEGRYELVRLIAVGAVGRVYEAKQVNLSRPVAIKLVTFPSDSTTDPTAMRERFTLEAETLARVAHPNVVGIFDVGVWRKDGFIAMELLEGRTLSEVFHEDGVMPIQRLIPIARQICSALAATHSQEIVHRDLKPSNIMLTRAGTRSDYVKIIDFGVAKNMNVRADLTSQGTLIGTPKYMAPEQITCNTEEIGPRSDIYSLGAIMYRAATGKGVFPQKSGMAQLIAHVREQPPSFAETNPDVALPAEFEAIVRKCLEKRPADRFSSMQELDDALALLDSGASLSVNVANATWNRQLRDTTLGTLASAAPTYSPDLTEAEVAPAPPPGQVGRWVAAAALALGGLAFAGFMMSSGAEKAEEVAPIVVPIVRDEVPPAPVTPTPPPVEAAAVAPPVPAEPVDKEEPAKPDNAKPEPSKPQAKEEPKKAAKKPEARSEPEPKPRAEPKPAPAPAPAPAAVKPAPAKPAPAPTPAPKGTDLKNPWER